MQRVLDLPLEPDPVIEAYKKDVDRTLLREQLRRTPLARLRQVEAASAFVERRRGAARSAARTRPVRS